MILYRISRLAYCFAEGLPQVKYITLVNLLATKDPLGIAAPPEKPHAAADRPLFPEFLSYEDCSLAVASQMIRWLLDSEQREGWWRSWRS